MSARSSRPILAVLVAAFGLGPAASGQDPAPPTPPAPPVAPPAAPAAPDAEADAAAVAEATSELAKGRYERALKLLADLTAPPDVVVAAFPALVEAQRLTGKLEAADASCASWLAATPEGPGRARPLLQRAEIRLERGNVDDAAADFQAAWLADPTVLAAKVGLAELHALAGRRADAERLFREAITFYNSPATGFDKRAAGSLVAGGRAAEGLGTVAGAVDGKPVGDPAMFEQAKSAYERAIRDWRKDPAAYLRAGALFQRVHNVAQAKSFFHDVLKENRSHPDGQAGLASCFLQEGNHDAARTHLARALEVNAAHPLARLVSARLETLAENYAAAATACEALLVANPAFAEARALRAACRFVLGDRAAYDAERSEFGRRHPGSGLVPHLVAALLSDQRRFEEAAAQEAEAIALDPWFWEAHIAHGMNLLRAGDEPAGQAALDTGFAHANYDVYAYNMKKLLKKLEAFETRKVGDFTLRFHPDERLIMGPYAEALLVEAHATLVTHYGGFVPQGPILFEMFPDANDFAVRTLGLPGLGALGACFGKVVTIDSPRAMQRPDGQGGQQPAFNWAATAWHEYAHVVTLQRSGGRVPRWFTEGLSEFEEWAHRKEWIRPMAERFAGMWRAGRLTPIATLNDQFTKGDVVFAYYQAGWICRFLAETKGRPAIVQMLERYRTGTPTPVVLEEVLGWSPAAFDAAFHAWLETKIGGWRLPALYGEAERSKLRQAVRKTPDDPKAQVALGRACWQANNPADAEVHAGRAAALDDTCGEAHFLLGEILAARKRQPAAHRRWQQAFERGHDDYAIRCRLADVAGAAGDDAATATHLEAALRHFPEAVGPTSPRLRLAELRFGAGKEAEGMVLLEAHVAREPEDVVQRTRLAAYYQREGRRADLLRTCEELNAVDPFRLPHHLWWVEALLAEKRIPEALREGEVAVELGKRATDAMLAKGQPLPPPLIADTARAFAWLGQARLAAGDRAGAREALEGARRTHAEVPEIDALASALGPDDK